MGFPLRIGSFGISVVLAFDAVQRTLIQPRNLLGGHELSSCTSSSFPTFPGLQPVCVSTAIALMLLAKPLPSGGAHGVHRRYRKRRHPAARLLVRSCSMSQRGLAHAAHSPCHQQHDTVASIPCCLVVNKKTKHRTRKRAEQPYPARFPTFQIRHPDHQKTDMNPTSAYPFPNFRTGVPSSFQMPKPVMAQSREKMGTNQFKKA